MLIQVAHLKLVKERKWYLILNFSIVSFKVVLCIALYYTELLFHLIDMKYSGIFAYCLLSIGPNVY